MERQPQQLQFDFGENITFNFKQTRENLSSVKLGLFVMDALGAGIMPSIFASSPKDIVMVLSLLVAGNIKAIKDIRKYNKQLKGSI